MKKHLSFRSEKLRDGYWNSH